MQITEQKQSQLQILSLCPPRGFFISHAALGWELLRSRAVRAHTYASVASAHGPFLTALLCQQFPPRCSGA